MSDSGLKYNGPINPNPGDGESSIIIYTYIPSLALGIIGVITFSLVFFVNLYYLIKKRGKGYRSFHILICVGAAMEAGGYGARIASHYRPFVVISFILQYFLIVVAPVLFSAAIYLSLTLLTRGIPDAERLLILRPKLILAFFITADAVCTIVQVCGAALIGVSESANAQGKDSPVTSKQANGILLAGLACQCFSFTTFLVIICIAIYRTRNPSFGGTGEPHGQNQKQLRTMLLVIFATSDLILLRTVFRLAETGQGFFGYASTHEWLFAILEYLPVILALIIWAVLPPSRFLEMTQTTGLSRMEGSKEVKEGRFDQAPESNLGRV